MSTWNYYADGPYYQQGDVLIKPVTFESSHWIIRDALERETKETENLTLAYGESTGHSHRVTGKIVHYVEKGKSDPIIFELTEDAVLEHEEHGTIHLPAGTYIVEQVREYDHFSEEARFVVD